MDKVVAHALSRIETHALLSGQPPKMDFTTIAATQATDPLSQLLQSSPDSLVVEAISLADSPHPVYCHTSTAIKCLIVPQPWRRTIFYSLHNLSHSGIRATQKLLALFGWVSMLMSDVAQDPVYNANVLKCKNILLPHSLHLLLLILALMLYTST